MPRDGGPDRDHDLQREVRLPALRHLDAGARAAVVLVQLAARRVPALHGARLADGDRPRARGAGPVAVARRGRDPAVGERRHQLLRADHAGDRRALRDRRRGAVGGARRGRAEPLPVRHERGQAVRLVPQPDGAQAVVHDHLRGDRPEPRAALPGDGQRLVAREDRGVHVGAAVPGVQGSAAAAGVARGQGRRPRDPRVQRDERQARARVARGARAVRPGPRDRAADPAGDRRAAAVPRERRRRLPVDGPRVGHAERRRGAADPAGDADRLVAGGRAVHPRRAVDRPPPARQRAPDRDPEASARPRQHGAGGRARRGHDARGRPPGRHGAGRRRARRLRGGGRHGGGRHGRAGVADRPVPGRHAADRAARRAPPAERLRRDPRGHAAQPQGDRRAHPARRVHRRHRRVGLGQVDARERDPLQGGVEPAAPVADAPGGAQAH